MNPGQSRDSTAKPVFQHTLHDLPHLSAYFNRLSKQLNQVANQTASVNESVSSADEFGQTGYVERRKRPAVKNGSISRPIGDRRTGAQQRCDRIEEPNFLQSLQKKRSVCLAWFMSRMSRDDGFQRISYTANPEVKQPYARISLGIWGYYFIAKLALFWMDLIPFHSLENLVFAVFILFFNRIPFLHSIKNTIILAPALALLYYDTWLPPIPRIVSQAASLSNFKFIYLVELVARFISLPVVGVLFAACLAYWFVSNRMRAGALVLFSMLALVFQSPISGLIAKPINAVEKNREADNSRLNMDQVVQTFFDKEAQRSVSFVAPHADAVPFDVIFIHVCSLSWDDVRYVGLDQHPLWRNFDMLLTKFNSATSYSGPAALHLLRATCGQPKHASMYSAAADNCYLMNSLQNSGFETNLAMNHSGKFDDFLGQVKLDGRVAALPLTLSGLDVAQRSFDNSPVFDDLTVLHRWQETRKKSNSTRVALYYNTVSLHDGNHLPGSYASPNTLKTYKVRLEKFLDEMDTFMKSLDESGRRTVVVMVPEHGGAVRGDRRQISGLREIPTPAITLVPVGVKVVGGNIRREGDTLSIDQPASYLAISHIVARMLENSPFNKNTFNPSDNIVNLPSTQFVAQTEHATVIEDNHLYYLNSNSTGWEDYAEFNAEGNR